MLKSPEKDVRNEKIGQLFTWNQSKGKLGFKFQADDNNQFEQVLAQLKADAKTHQLGEGLFDIDPAALTIKLTKPNFIRWQKTVLTYQIGKAKRIFPNERIFFQCGNKYFTIPLNKEKATSLKKSLMVHVANKDLNITFIKADDGTVEISSQEYHVFNNSLLMKSKIVPINEREFHKDEDANCYYIMPSYTETLKELSSKLRSFLNRKKASAELEINYKLNRVEMDTKSYQVINESISQKNLPKTFATKRDFHEREDCFYTVPKEYETLNSVYADLKYHFDTKRKVLEVTLSIDEKNNCICMPKDKYMQWKDKLNSRMRRQQNINHHEFVFDKTNDYYVLKQNDKELVQKKYAILKRRCKTLSLPISILHRNSEKDEITISKEDYEQLVSRDKQKQVERNQAYGMALTKDPRRNIYFYNSKKSSNMTRSFNALASLLEIKVKFETRNKRTEITAKDYERWISNPIISQSVSVSDRKVNLTEDSHGFSFDKDQNKYVKRFSSQPNLRKGFFHLTEKCNNLAFPIHFFEKDKSTVQIKVSADDYHRYTRAHSIMEVTKCQAYGMIFTKDNERAVYFFSDKSINMLNSFKKIARILNIDVRFVRHGKRIELSMEHYERWISNPIIKKSLIQTSTVSDSSSIQNNRVTKRNRKTQTLHNTKGGISVKYLEDAITIPWLTNTKSTKEDKDLFISKGYVIPFDTLQNTLLATDNKRRFSGTVKFDTQGIKGSIKLYSSQKGNAETVFSKNVIFVRAGRKEAAWLPKITGKDQANIIVMVSQAEFEEMQVTLGRSFICKLPAHIKLCIIESCELAKQPESQPSSYLRSCNIKRVMAYALAHHYQLKDFLLIDDNTRQIQVAEKVAPIGNIDALFDLFRKYKERGAMYATLGSYAPFKNIARPLEATQIEALEQHLGTKIAFVAFESIVKELQVQNKQLHDILSPCSLLWGEDYFNILAIIQLLHQEGVDGIAGVIPYSVAWHERNQAGQNKAKSNSGFQLANAWLRIDSAFLEKLTPHQQQVVVRLKELVSTAIEKQNLKEQKYLAQLEITNDEPTMIPEKGESLEEATIAQELSVVEWGKEHGSRNAARGYPLDVDKLTKKISQQFSSQYAEQYINGFKTGHEAVWSSLSEKKRAYYRGEYEGFLAARQGFKTSECRIPSLYQAHQSIFLKGFNNGNMLQWKSMQETDNLPKVKSIAEEMGVKRANTGYDINEQKLTEIAKNFGANAEYFMEQYRAEFNLERSLMPIDEIVTKKAQQVAIMLSQKSQVLDVKKLEQASKEFGEHKELYQRTVTTQFEKLRQQQSKVKEKMLELVVVKNQLAV